ncbi:MAG: hypothetical protein ABI670_01440 [Chloroflexota bacterium]
MARVKLSTPLRILFVLLVSVNLTLFCQGHMLGAMHSGAHLALLAPVNSDLPSKHAESAPQPQSHQAHTGHANHSAHNTAPASAHAGHIESINASILERVQSASAALAVIVAGGSGSNGSVQLPMVGSASDVPMPFSVSTLGLVGGTSDAAGIVSYPLEQPGIVPWRSRLSSGPEPPPPQLLSA